MAVRFKFRFYDVSFCGYYERGSACTPTLGDFSWTTNKLVEWLTGRAFEDSCTYLVAPPSKVEDNESSGYTGLGTYCWDFSSLSGRGTMLVLWNEIPTSKGDVLSVPRSGVVGSTPVSTAQVKKGHVPGYPAYWWLLPSEGKVAACWTDDIRFGRAQFDRYVQNFLEHRSPARQYILDDEGNSVGVGYTISETSKPEPRLPRFGTRALRRAREIDPIIEHHAKVTHLLRKETGVIQSKSKRKLDLLNWIGIPSPTDVETKDEKVFLKCEIAYQPTQDELKKLVEEWEQDDGETNLGVKLKGEDGEKWFRDALVKTEASLQIAEPEHGVYSAKDVLSAVAKHKDRLLGSVEDVLDGRAVEAEADGQYPPVGLEEET